MNPDLGSPASASQLISPPPPFPTSRVAENYQVHDCALLGSRRISETDPCPRTCCLAPANPACLNPDARHATKPRPRKSESRTAATDDEFGGGEKGQVTMWVSRPPLMKLPSGGTRISEPGGFFDSIRRSHRFLPRKSRQTWPMQLTLWANDFQLPFWIF
jgi:hypothetical protein